MSSKELSAAALYLRIHLLNPCADRAEAISCSANSLTFSQQDKRSTWRKLTCDWHHISLVL